MMHSPLATAHPNTQDATRAERHVRWMREAMIAICGALLAIAVLAPFVLRSALAPRVNATPPMGVVDLAQLVKEADERLAKLLEGKLVDRNDAAHTSSTPTLDTGTREAERFARALDRAITSVAVDCGCTLMNAAAILAGNITDLTPQVRARLMERP